MAVLNESRIETYNNYSDSYSIKFTVDVNPSVPLASTVPSVSAIGGVYPLRAAGPGLL